jgi:hypothetical protein
LLALCAPITAYSGKVEFPELFKYSEQKNANLETALLSISHSFKDNSVPVTQELLAAVMATLDKEVGGSYLPVEEQGDYGMGPSSTYTVGGSRRSTPYDGGIDYKGRGYIQITGKGNYQTYCGSDCIGTSSPELDVCGCKNQWQCTATDASTCPQVKALQTDYAARIFASYYVKNGLVSLANAENYNAVGKVINGGAVYASDFNAIANAYLMLFSNNPDKTNRLLTWLNSGATVDETTQKEVTLSLYVHDESRDGPTISDVQVTGHDGSDNSFEQTTDNNGLVTIIGEPGTWSFSVSASGYETNNWDQDISETDTKDAFLQRKQSHEFGGVEYPNGITSFADHVVSYNPCNGVKTPRNNPNNALGSPDYKGVDSASYVSLGNAENACDCGSLVLEFIDNTLVDVPGNDLYVYEVGPGVEATEVFISTDGQEWIDLGKIDGSLWGIDIHDSVSPGQEFHFVKLCDYPDGNTGSSPSPGPDIDAVGAIGNAI